MPTLLQQARFALGELEMRPRKQLGQHFLIDPTVVDRIIAAAHIGLEDTILEIGPGLGALSDALAGLAARLYLVEMDTVLTGRLRERFTGNDRVQVITADFLSLDLPTTFPEPEIHVVASLPYNVATPILFRLLEHRHKFADATVMIQKEVAERLGAAPGSKAYGVPSVLTQLYAEEKPIKQEFWLKGKLILVEDVPAGVCSRCGEKVVRADVGRWIMALIEDSKRLRKARTISVPVIKFAKKVAGAAPEDVELRSNRVTRPRSTAAR